MASPKIRPLEFSKLFENKTANPLHEKKEVEVLIKHLNEKIQKDPKLQKKAAIILEEWLKKKSRP